MSTLLIAQISDLHLVAPGRLLYRRIDTTAALVRAVDRLNALVPRPDLVVVSGDLVDRGSVAEYQHLQRQLARLEMPYRLMPGNHDQRAALREVFPGQEFGGAPLLCQRVVLDGLVLLLLDTVIAGAEGGEIGDAQLAWLDENCPDHGPVLLVQHHPPFATGIAGMDVIGLAGAERLGEWLERHRNVIAVACGHVHRAVFSSFAGIPALIAPSVAHQVALDLGGDDEALAWTPEPGGLLLHRWAGGRLVSHLLPVDAAPVQRYG